MDNLQRQKFVLRIKPIENGEVLAEVVGPAVYAIVGCITLKIVISESELSTKSKFSYRNTAHYQFGNG